MADCRSATAQTSHYPYRTMVQWTVRGCSMLPLAPGPDGCRRLGTLLLLRLRSVPPDSRPLRRPANRVNTRGPLGMPADYSLRVALDTNEPRYRLDRFELLLGPGNSGDDGRGQAGGGGRSTQQYADTTVLYGFCHLRLRSSAALPERPFSPGSDTSVRRKQWCRYTWEESPRIDQESTATIIASASSA